MVRENDKSLSKASRKLIAFMFKIYRGRRKRLSRVGTVACVEHHQRRWTHSDNSQAGWVGEEHIED